MEVVFKGMIWKEVLVFIDDMISFAKTFNEALERLGRVLLRIEEANLKLKPSKCHFMKREARVLGFMISAAGMTADKSKVDKVLSWAVPKTVREVRGLLGFSLLL